MTEHEVTLAFLQFLSVVVTVSAGAIGKLFLINVSQNKEIKKLGEDMTQLKLDNAELKVNNTKLAMAEENCQSKLAAITDKLDKSLEEGIRVREELRSFKDSQTLMQSNRHAENKTLLKEIESHTNGIVQQLKDASFQDGVDKGTQDEKNRIK